LLHRAFSLRTHLSWMLPVYAKNRKSPVPSCDFYLAHVWQ
jgi:hypothetical protein